MLKSAKAQREQTFVVPQNDPEELTSVRGAMRVVDVREPFKRSDERVATTPLSRRYE